MRMIFGIDKIKRGKIIYMGQELRIRQAKDAIDAGISMVPENRKEEGLVLDKDIRFNSSLNVLPRIFANGFINAKLEDEISKLYADKLEIKTPSLDQTVINLSGGNQQFLLSSFLRNCRKLSICAIGFM